MSLHCYYWDKVAPSMVIPYRRMCWLAQLARSPGTAQTVAQAIWERTQSPKAIDPLGRALQEFRHLGWRSLRGCWQWSLPRTGTVVHLVHAPKEYVEHLFRESLWETQLAALEKRRPRTFGGMGARLERRLTLSDIATCDKEVDKSVLQGVQPTGPIGEGCARTIAAPITLKGSAKTKSICSSGVQHGKRSETPSYWT